MSHHQLLCTVLYSKLSFIIFGISESIQEMLLDGCQAFYLGPTGIIFVIFWHSFWEGLPGGLSPVTCHLSHVTDLQQEGLPGVCHLSPVTCHLSHVTDLQRFAGGLSRLLVLELRLFWLSGLGGAFWPWE